MQRLLLLSYRIEAHVQKQWLKNVKSLDLLKGDVAYPQNGETDVLTG